MEIRVHSYIQTTQSSALASILCATFDCSRRKKKWQAVRGENSRRRRQRGAVFAMHGAPVQPTGKHRRTRLNTWRKEKEENISTPTKCCHSRVDRHFHLPALGDRHAELSRQSAYGARVLLLDAAIEGHLRGVHHRLHSARLFAASPAERNSAAASEVAEWSCAARSFACAEWTIRHESSFE